MYLESRRMYIMNALPVAAKEGQGNTALAINIRNIKRY